METNVERFCREYGVERKGTNSVKWDGMQDKFTRGDLLPLWVADMDFKMPKKAQEALATRVAHGAFGYGFPSTSYYKHYFNWQKERYQVSLRTDWIRFSTGVVNAFYWMVNAFTKENDGVLVLSPVYYPFYEAIRENHRQLVTSELINQEEGYLIDFEDVEKKIIENHVKLFIHCSPHNPVGRVWTKEELSRLFDICVKHEVIIVSDEIHQDLVRKDVSYTSALAMDERYYPYLIALNAPSKTFNLAGLLNSHIVIPDKTLRDTYDTYAAGVNKATNSILGLVATEACYEYGAEWLEGLLEVIEFNYNWLKSHLLQEFPSIKIADKQGTYLMWLDISAYIPSNKMIEFLEETCGLAVDYGEWFGDGGEGYIRINLGTTYGIIQLATDKLIQGLRKWVE